LGNECIAKILELIIELLTSTMVKNTKHGRKNTNSKIVDVATSKTREM
jgi:hypothetical protein